jgi:hypothetical protein
MILLYSTARLDCIVSGNNKYVGLYSKTGNRFRAQCIHACHRLEGHLPEEGKQKMTTVP